MRFIKDQLQRFGDWLSLPEGRIVVGILFVATVLRLYKIREYLTFLGDQGRDVLIVRDMLVHGDITFLGPITSVGSIFLGPLYYYMMAPFLALSRFDPVGPAFMIVFFSLATIVLLYKLCKEYLSFSVFVFAGVLYATSPLVLIHSRFSWNPNAVPFFALLYIYALLKVLADKKDHWLFIVGIALGVLVQLHYLTLILTPLAGIVLIVRKFKIKPKHLGFLVLGTVLPLLPFAAFEIKHGLINTQTAFRFITKHDGTSNIAIQDFSKHVEDVLVRWFWRLIVVENAEITKAFIVSLCIGIALWYRKIHQNRRYKKLYVALLMLAWFFVSLFLYGIYQGTVYDYYFVPVFPLPFILTGIFLTYIYRRSVLGKCVAGGILLVFVYFHLTNNPFQYSPNNQVEQTKQVAAFILEQSDGQPYNFALLANKNSDHAYRYFLEVLGDKPIAIQPPDVDPDRETVTSQLFIACEEQECHPLGHPLWEIAGFGSADIESEWDRGVIKVFKLVPSTEVHPETQ